MSGRCARSVRRSTFASRVALVRLVDGLQRDPAFQLIVAKHAHHHHSTTYATCSRPTSKTGVTYGPSSNCSTPTSAGMVGTKLTSCSPAAQAPKTSHTSSTRSTNLVLTGSPSSASPPSPTAMASTRSACSTHRKGVSGTHNGADRTKRESVARATDRGAPDPLVSFGALVLGLHCNEDPCRRRPTIDKLVNDMSSAATKCTGAKRRPTEAERFTKR